MTSVRTYSEPVAYAAAVEPLLAADRARSTVISTVLAGLLAQPYQLPPVLAVAFDDDHPVAAALQTPPYPLTVLAAAGSGTQEQWAGLATAVHAVGAMPEILSGPAGDVHAFAAAWAQLTGAGTEPYDALLLYRLGEFTPPMGCRAALGGPTWTTLPTSQWWRSGSTTSPCSPAVPPSQGPDPMSVRTRAARGATTVLWIDEGRPVAMAGHSVVVGGMARIGPVFTPEELRGRHFGSAVTAAAVVSAREAGATDVVLFTDADFRHPTRSTAASASSRSAGSPTCRCSTVEPRPTRPALAPRAPPRARSGCSPVSWIFTRFSRPQRVNIHQAGEDRAGPQSQPIAWTTGRGRSEVIATGSGCSS